MAKPKRPAAGTLNKRLLVLSLDGLASYDVEKIRALPAFQKLLSGGYRSHTLLCPYVQSVYPSLTYPAHVTIGTGLLPRQHGIVGNVLLQPNAKHAHWYWYSRMIKGKPIYDLAREAGLSVAALLWPVTAGADIRYNMPEILPTRDGQSQAAVSLGAGSPVFQAYMSLRYGKLRSGTKQPALDNFTHASLLDVLSRRKPPELILAHYTDLDSTRHQYGVFSKEADDALQRHDRRLGEIMDLLQRRGLSGETALVVLGDHGHKDTRWEVTLNSLLWQKGYIDTISAEEAAAAEKGRSRKYDAVQEGRYVKSWRYIANCCDGSAYIYSRFPGGTDQTAIEKLRGDIEQAAAQIEQGNPIAHIYTGAEAAAKGADPRCVLMVEAAQGYYFRNGIAEQPVREALPGDYPTKHTMLSTHGYDPELPEYGTVFLVSAGFSPRSLAAFIRVAEGQWELSGMHLKDEFAVFQEILGLQ